MVRGFCFRRAEADIDSFCLSLLSRPSTTLPTRDTHVCPEKMKNTGLTL